MSVTASFLSVLSLAAPGMSTPVQEGRWRFEADESGLSVRTPDKQWTFELGGRLHLDGVAVDDELTQLEDGFALRRARVDGTLRYGKRWSARVDYDFGGLVEGWYSTWLRYDAPGPWRYTAGNMLVPFGLENATSSNDTTFLERSQTSALLPGFAVGFQAEHAGENSYSALGVFGDPLDAAPSRRSEGVGLFARHTRALWRDGDERLWHIGASAEWRDVDDGSRYRMRVRPELGTVERRLIDSRNLFDVDSALTYGAESALQFGPFSLQGEWIGAQLARDSQDVAFSAWYTQASYFLSGQSRRYRADRGSFTDPAGLSKDDAWELALRYSVLDLEDGDVTGGEGRNWTAGLNWYVNRNVRVMLNYVQADATPNRNGLDETARALALRLQLAF